MGRRTWRTLGAGLMEAGNQAQIYNKQQTADRRLKLEQQRQDNLMSIAEGRQGLMRERLDFMQERQVSQDARQGTQDERQLTQDQETAIDSVQTRLDDVMEPGDREFREYVRARDGVIQNSEDLGADQMAAQLKVLEDNYRISLKAGYDPDSEEGKARAKEVSEYVAKINNIIKVGGRKIKRAYGDTFSGSIADYLYLGEEVEHLADSPEEQAAAIEAADLERIQEADERNVEEEAIASAPGTGMFERPGRAGTAPAPLMPRVDPATGRPLTPQGNPSIEDYPELGGRPPAPLDFLSDPLTPRRRRLEADETGSLMGPGPGGPGS